MVPFFFAGDGSIAKGKEDLPWMELLWLTVKMAGLAAVPLLVADLYRGGDSVVGATKETVAEAETRAANEQWRLPLYSV